jgi:hypothetical protein
MSTLSITHSPHEISPGRLVAGFIAGFLAVLLFHQPVLLLLHFIGFENIGAYVMRSTEPFGVPVFVSLAFWGGVWGAVFATIDSWFPRGAAYWFCAVAFGAVFPSLVAWFVVLPLKHLPVAGGWHLHGVITALLINGAWGFGTALFYRLLTSQVRT